MRTTVNTQDALWIHHRLCVSGMPAACSAAAGAGAKHSALGTRQEVRVRPAPPGLIGLA